MMEHSNAAKEARGMQGTTQFQTGKPPFKRGVRSVAQEARALIRRRKISYAAFAFILLAAAVYASTTHANSNPDASPPKSFAQTKTEPTVSAATQDTLAVDGQSSNHNSGGESNMNSTSVTVNGQNVAVPDNGTTQTTINGDGSTTSVDVSHSSSGGSNYNYSSLQVNVQTNSSSDEGGE